MSEFKYVVRALPNPRNPDEDPIVAEFKYASDAFAFAHVRRWGRYKAQTRSGQPIGEGWIPEDDPEPEPLPVRDQGLGHGAKILDILERS